MIHVKRFKEKSIFNQQDQRHQRLTPTYIGFQKKNRILTLF
jgi:hypothetical protein